MCTCTIQGCLDLHGLYTAEATDVTRDFLNRIIPAHQFYEIEIITGAGNHSTGHVAKIKVRMTTQHSADES